VSDTESVTHWRCLERMFAGAAINAEFTPALVVDDGTATVRQTIRDAQHHAGHAAHGAVLFKMLDDAAYFAAASTVREVFLVTVSFNTVFLRPVAEGEITATGVLVHRSRNLLVAEAALRDARDRLIATATGTFQRSAMPLDAAVGYSQE